MVKKIKIFPKIQKKLRSFLADESGKITKKDALGLSAGAALLGGIDEVSAGHISGRGYATGSDAEVGVSVNAYGALRGTYVSPANACNHASGIVNGHYSSTPNGKQAYFKGDGGSPTISGHASHGSHGSHGSRW